MSKIEIEYYIARKVGMGEAFSHWEDQAFMLATENPEELESLIKLFNSEEDSFLKFLIAGVLAKLQWKQAVPFLLERLQEADEDDQYDSALSLIELREEKGAEVLFKLAKESKEIPTHWFYYDLIEIDNELAKNTLRELIRRYPKIAEVAKNASIGRDFLK